MDVPTARAQWLSAWGQSSNTSTESLATPPINLLVAVAAFPTMRIREPPLNKSIYEHVQRDTRLSAQGSPEQLEPGRDERVQPLDPGSRMEAGR